MGNASTVKILLAVVVPFIVLAILIGGHLSGFEGLILESVLRSSDCWTAGGPEVPAAISEAVNNAMGSAAKSVGGGGPCRNSSKPDGAEAVPRSMIVRTSDFHFRRLWGVPKEDLPAEVPRNLLALTVSAANKDPVNKIVSKFPREQFAIILFHYDGLLEAYRAFDWYPHVVHVSGLRQTKWWFAKRFLHPDIVAVYDYVFLWDQDLGVDNFDPVKYLDIVRGAGLDISQPAIDPESHERSHSHWAITQRVGVKDSAAPAFHTRVMKDSPFRDVSKGCTEESTELPCAGFVETMAPVYVREAWKCVWHMIQNDLVHGWGMDGPQGECARKPHHEHVGVVDAQYISHMDFTSMKGEGESNREAVQKRCHSEQDMFDERWRAAKAAEGRGGAK